MPEQSAIAEQAPSPAEVVATRPALKWAGGKRWQLPHLEPYWNAHKGSRLVEPFCGGLAVALGLQPKNALLNDINPHLVNFYRWLKKGLKTRLVLENDEVAYYENRQRFNALIKSGREETADAAALFYYLNRTGYNGLCRFNKSGGFNVPFGRYKQIHYRYDFTEYSAVFETWDFQNIEFDKLRLRSTDFIYADPPYDVEFRQYSKGGFSWEDQERTAEWLAKHSGPVILVNQATKRIIKLYKSLGYHLRSLSGPRRISCTGDRSPAKEVMALRNF